MRSPGSCCIAVVLSLLLFAGCIKPHSRLYQCNRGIFSESLPGWLTLPSQTGKLYTFHIRHQQVEDLSTCWMGIMVGSKVVYWDWYRKDASCRLDETVKDIVIYLYDTQQREFYSWKDSTTYKLTPGPAGNLEIELLTY